MTDDRELLRQYAEEAREGAFAELVRRHVDLVYSAALRQMNGDAHRAQEVTSMTFASLARKAGSLLRHPVLPAWLYRSTYFSAAMLKRSEARRAVHERAAAEELAVLGAGEGAGADWAATRPVLDAAMADLAERDREAIVLRFFSNAPFGEVGRRLGLSENAARMRVDRAMEKLRAKLASKGVTSTAAALGVVLSEQAVAAAPVGVAAGIMSTALAGASAGAGAGAGLLQFMAATKFQIAGWAAVLAVGGGLVTVEQRAEARMARQVAAQHADGQDLAELRSQVNAMTSHLHQLQALQARADQADAAQRRLEAARAKTRQLLHAQQTNRAAALQGVEIYDLNHVDEQPTPTHQARPQYPFEARRDGRGGTVTVDFVVDAQGNVRNAFVVNSTDREFEASAVAAVAQWQFSAGRRKGATVPVHMQVPIVFSIGNGRAPSGPPPSEWFNEEPVALKPNADAFSSQTSH